ncbi:MAG TPA: prepilin-type N-terminal cleavage/methylation domain-containing protein [Gemmatimonadales bacterium]|jgi:prepilin-type N-terminal cleavage/methylation domain-containing protein|nr:prepilin-type N-terminal cleavage/methylation domain-containing protein [Gemmatimonadales bacterium]
MQLTRRGFTLVELLVALVLLGVITAALYRVLVTNQRVYQAQTQRIDLQQNIRAAVTILPAEFRELAASDGDIQVMTSTQLQIRAMRWLGFVCQAPVLGGLLGGVQMTIRAAPFYGARGINTATDSMFIYYDGNPASRLDDTWARAKPTAATLQNCPAGPGTQITMNLALGAAPNVAGAIPVGAPVRGYERVTYQLYQPAGDTSWYVGLQPAGGTMQPLIGPVLPNGLTLTYFDSLGVATANPARVARIDIIVRARTAQPVRAAGGSGALIRSVDSVVTSVALRNNRRF